MMLNDWRDEIRNKAQHQFMDISATAGLEHSAAIFLSGQVE
jgi:hypothetical protein